MKKSVYKAAVIGLGNIGGFFSLDEEVTIDNVLNHAQCYQLHSATELVGGVSPDKHDQERFVKNYGVNAYSELDEMLHVEEPDIVSICSPTEFHYQQVKDCIDKGVAMIWLEKPATRNLKELDDIIDVCSCSNTKILVNYQRRYLDVYSNLKEVYSSKQLGDPITINLTYSKGLEINGSHIIDIAHYVAGATLPFKLDSSAKEVSVNNPSFICMTSELNIPVVVSGIDAPYHSIDISVSFTKGRYSVLHGGMTTVWEEMEEHELYSGFYRLVTKELPFNTVIGHEGCFVSALNDMLESHEKRVEPQSNLQTARMTQFLIEQVRNADKRA